MHSLESAMSIFKPKEYLNRHLLNLEKTLDLQRSSALSFQQRTISQEQELLRMNEKMQHMQQELIQVYSKCESQLRYLQELEEQA